VLGRRYTKSARYKTSCSKSAVKTRLASRPERIAVKFTFTFFVRALVLSLVGLECEGIMYHVSQEVWPAVDEASGSFAKKTIQQISCRLLGTRN
jgi:hypothetical protein